MKLSPKIFDHEQIQGFSRAFLQVFPDKTANEAESYLKPPYHIELYEMDDKVLGFMVLLPVEDQAEIIQLGVVPQARGQGIGFQMMELSDCLGFKKIFLEVADNNFAAIDLYAKAGYKEYSRRKAYYTIKTPSGTIRTDAILMQKFFK